MPRVLFGFAVFLALLFPLPVAAQDAATGAIRGTVVDPGGLRISAAEIVVVNNATGRRYSVTTDSEGRFAVDLLPPGDYSARATAKGMSPQITPVLHVDLGAATEIEFRLSLASVKENVTVSGEPQLVETQPSAVSTILDERALVDLPLNGRRFSDLLLLSPGVTQDPRGLTSSTNAIFLSEAFAAFKTVFWSTASISTTASSPRLADATALLTSFPTRSCRSSAFLPIPTALNSGVPEARS